jgi:hypothetical protein
MIRIKKIVKAIYTLIPKPKYYKHLYFKGFFEENFMGKSFYIYSLPTIIENTIFWEGIEKGYEQLTLKCWYFICKNSDNVFDIGSNTGIFILISHVSNTKSRKYSFEPSKKFTYAQDKIKKKTILI